MFGRSSFIENLEYYELRFDSFFEKVTTFDADLVKLRPTLKNCEFLTHGWLNFFKPLLPVKVFPPVFRNFLNLALT